MKKNWLSATWDFFCMGGRSTNPPGSTWGLLMEHYLLRKRLGRSLKALEKLNDEDKYATQEQSIIRKTFAKVCSLSIDIMDLAQYAFRLALYELLIIFLGAAAILFTMLVWIPFLFYLIYPK